MNISEDTPPPYEENRLFPWEVTGAYRNWPVQHFCEKKMNESIWTVMPNRERDDSGHVKKTAVVLVERMNFMKGDNHEGEKEEDRKYILLTVEESVYNAVLKMMGYGATSSYEYDKKIQQYEKAVKEYCDQFPWLRTTYEGPPRMKMMLFDKGGNEEFATCGITTLGFHIDYDEKHDGGGLVNLFGITRCEKIVSCKACTRISKKKHKKECRDCQFREMYTEDGPCKKHDMINIRCFERYKYRIENKLYKKREGRRLLDLLLK